MVSPLGISEHIHYFDPASGIKIASYLENAHACDSVNQDNVQRCMVALQSFYRQRRHVDHTFDLWERLNFYGSLWQGVPFYYANYQGVKRAVLSLSGYIEAQPKEDVLCHIDAVPDNFMLVTGKDGQEEIKLIDWEYAGMQNPHLDIAMFAVYAINHIHEIYVIGYRKEQFYE